MSQKQLNSANYPVKLGTSQMFKVSNSLHSSNQRDLRFGQASGGWRRRWNSELCSDRVEFPRPMIQSDRRRTQHALGSVLRLAEETYRWGKKIRKLTYI